MLLGLTEPTGGRAIVAGFDPLREPLDVKRRVGYLPDQVGFYDGLSARDNLAYTGRLAGLPRRDIRRALCRGDGAGRPRRGRPSAGPHLLAGHAAAARPRRGADEAARASRSSTSRPPRLDPHSTQEFLEMIRALKADGTAVLLSSHHLDQVQSVCDRVALFNRGRIALSGSVTELAGRVLGGGHVIDVEARSPEGPGAIADRLAAVPASCGCRRSGANATGSIASATCGPRSRAGLAPEVELIGIHFAAPSLTEVYNRYFEEARDAAQ